MPPPPIFFEASRFKAAVKGEKPLSPIFASLCPPLSNWSRGPCISIQICNHLLNILYEMDHKCNKRIGSSKWCRSGAAAGQQRGSSGAAAGQQRGSSGAAHCQVKATMER